MTTRSYATRGLLFFAAAFVISGALFVIQELLQIPGEAQLPMYGPALGAVLLVQLEGGGIAGFFRSRLTFTVTTPLLLGLAIPVVIQGGISYWTQEQWKLANVREIDRSAIFFMLSMLPAVIGEELGWRGYLLPTLQEKYTPFISSWFVGCAWIAWHIPTKLMAVTLLVPWAIMVMALSFLATFVYNKTGPSTWSAILLHYATNIMGYLFLGQYLVDTAVSILTSTAFLLAALFVVVLDWKAFSTAPVPGRQPAPSGFPGSSR